MDFNLNEDQQAFADVAAQFANYVGNMFGQPVGKEETRMTTQHVTLAEHVLFGELLLL